MKDDFTGRKVDGCEECESQSHGACIECLVDQLKEDKKKGDSRLKTFKVRTNMVVQTVVGQDFWVQAENAEDAENALSESGFSSYDNPNIEEGDETNDCWSETVEVEILETTEEEDCTE